MSISIVTKKTIVAAFSDIIPLEKTNEKKCENTKGIISHSCSIETVSSFSATDFTFSYKPRVKVI